MSGICEGSGASFFSSGQIVLASSGQLQAQNTENIRYSCGPKLLGIYGRLLYVQCCWQCLVYVKAQVLPFSRVARLSWHHQGSCRRGLIITERTSTQLFDAGAASTNTSKNNLLEDKIITDVASSDQHQTQQQPFQNPP